MRHFATIGLTAPMSSTSPLAAAILGAGASCPTLRSQAEMLAAMGYASNPDAVAIARGSRIETRSFHRTPADFAACPTPDELAAYHRERVPAMALEALRAAAAGVTRLSDIDAVITATSTGYLMPGLAEILGDEATVGTRGALRVNLVGQGCHAALPAIELGRALIGAGLARTVAVVCSEASLAHFNPGASKRTLVTNLIFGEGAAAVILGSPGAPVGKGALPAVLDGEQVMASGVLDGITCFKGGGYADGGMRREVPEVAAAAIAEVVDRLLARHELTRDDIAHWAFHTGGPKVLDQIQQRLQLDDAQLAPVREILRTRGNVLSATALLTLAHIVEERRPARGELGLLVAAGPGMTAGALLLRWP